ncbi:DUF4177 domain-containing protein [Amaricoccus macauensis]|uniref:DUF4177 domain-containing protein n=1 Tax=Amaricoccus macauensis TaxID=57001 RepID=UPI003C7D66F5
MDHFDYKAVPAPRRSKKAKGVREPAELFAMTLTDAINEQSREGWEYVRAETLPAETPRGFFRRAAEEDVTMLIFRRARASRDPLIEAHTHAGGERPLMAARAEPAIERGNGNYESQARPARQEPRFSQDNRGRPDEFSSPLRPTPQLESAD